MKGKAIEGLVKEAAIERKTVTDIKATDSEIVLRFVTSKTAASFNKTLPNYLKGKRRGTKLFFNVSGWTSKELRNFLLRLSAKSPAKGLSKAVNDLKEQQEQLKEQLNLLPTVLEKLNELADLKQQLEGLLGTFGELKGQLQQLSEQISSVSGSLDLLPTRFDALSKIVQNLQQQLSPPKQEWGPREGESVEEWEDRIQREHEEWKRTREKSRTEWKPFEHLP